MRIYVCLNRYSRQDAPQCDAVDVCKECWPPSPDDLVDLYEGKVSAEEIADDIKEAIELKHDHAPYNEVQYDCAVCGKRLGEDD